MTSAGAQGLTGFVAQYLLRLGDGIEGRANDVSSHRTTPTRSHDHDGAWRTRPNVTFDTARMTAAG